MNRTIRCALPLVRLRTLVLAMLPLNFALSASPALAQSFDEDMLRMHAYAVSPDGSTLVGSTNNSSGGLYAIRWSAASGLTDLGLLPGGVASDARALSSDGQVVVGLADSGSMNWHAFRWTPTGGMVDLGTLGGAQSYAWGTSADGAVVVGSSDTATTPEHAFRWTSAGGMVDLNTLGGDVSYATGVSADGNVVVGAAQLASGEYRPFRWTSGGMVALGTLGGADAYAMSVSADGNTIAGYSYINATDWHAFHWTSGGMTDLGTLGGTNSQAVAISGNGLVVVGDSYVAGDAETRAFRWTAGGGMQSVEDWLRASGVSVAADLTSDAAGVNHDGSVVVGTLSNMHAFVARAGSGLVELEELGSTITLAASGGSMALAVAGTQINGAHSRPLMRRATPGGKVFWTAGDWGKDNHGGRNGNFGLAEAGLGQHFGPFQANVALGTTWARQKQDLGGQTTATGSYLLAEALLPLAGPLWGVLGGYWSTGEAEVRRAYTNAGLADASQGKPGVESTGLRARLELDRGWQFGAAELSPFVDLSYVESKLDAYIEVGGGFPVTWNAREEKATEWRFGVNASLPLASGARLLGGLDAVHRKEKAGARSSGEVAGLFPFAIEGQALKRDWGHAMAGVEGRLADGVASLTINLTTQGEAPDGWLAANWQKAF
jgi:probable HAF family extracellular repeat protein